LHGCDKRDFRYLPYRVSSEADGHAASLTITALVAALKEAHGQADRGGRPHSGGDETVLARSPAQPTELGQKFARPDCPVYDAMW
jgi:hypothetical protein